MPIERPAHATFHKDRGNTSILSFLKGSREEYVRGAVCWPMMPGVGVNNRSVEGCALIAGQHVDSGLISIYEEKSFVCIDPIRNPQTGDLEFEGLVNFLNAGWSRYFASTYYWHQDEETCKRHLLAVIRSDMIQPKPAFVPVPWTDDAQAEAAVWQMLTVGRLAYNKGGLVHTQLQRYQAQPTVLLPAIHALRCLVAGFERYPYRKPR